MSRRAPAAGSQSSLRDANRNLVVETVKRYGGLTQVELSEATGLSQATVSTIVRELLAAGVVDTATTTRSGRRAQMVTLARRVGLAAGVQIGHRHLRLVLGDFSHQVIAEQTLPLPADHRVDTSLDRVALLVVDLVERVGASLDDVVGLGVGLPAPVDDVHGHGLGARHHARLGHGAHRPGAVQAAGPAGVRGQRRQPRRDRREHARCGAAVQRQRVRARVLRHGRRIVINGQVHRGVAGTAGEIGHVQVAFPGELCRCGNRGCLDTVVGASALIDRLRVSSGPLALRDVVQRAIDGDERCGQVVAEAGAMIGMVVAGLGVAVNPQLVVVGGELAETGELLLRPLREAVRRNVLLNQIAPLEVVAASLGSRAEVIGALVLALQSTALPLRVDDDQAAVGVGAAQ